MKQNRMTFVAVAATLFLVTMGVPAAMADSVLLTLAAPDSAITPFSGPFGTVFVNLINPTDAQITFTADTSGGFTYMFMDSGAVDVNVNRVFASTFTPKFDSATGPTTGGFSSPSFVGFGSGNVDGFGSFDLTTDMFNGTDHPSTTIMFDILDTGGTWANAAQVLTPDSNNAEIAAHIVVFNSNNVVNGQQLATGFVANTGAFSTPDGGLTLILLGGALVGLETLRRRFRV